MLGIEWDIAFHKGYDGPHEAVLHGRRQVNCPVSEPEFFEQCSNIFRTCRKQHLAGFR